MTMIMMMKLSSTSITKLLLYKTGVGQLQASLESAPLEQIWETTAQLPHVSDLGFHVWMGKA